MERYAKISAHGIMILLCLDIFVINLSSFLALLFRFDLSFIAIAASYLEAIAFYALINTATTIALFFPLKLYTAMWRFAGIKDCINIILACVLSGLIQLIGMSALGLVVPRSYYILSLCILIILEMAVRLSSRIFRTLYFEKNDAGIDDKTNVMIVGAGNAGSIIIREINSTEQIKKRVVCVIDDDPRKKGKYLYGCHVTGNRNTIYDASKKFNVREVIVAIPSANRTQLKEILNICRTTNCRIMMLPGIYQLINGEVTISKLREVHIEDLLGREQTDVNLDRTKDYVSGKTVLVTGGGGSIGSELCRQIAAYEPKELIMLDIYENNAYEMQQEIKVKYPALKLTVLIGSVRDAKRLDEIFHDYMPELVFHAAAHKHVPLMEDSPAEAIKNNVCGTYNAATSASKYGVDRFVLISTDKAVNPTSIMGASKRICEMIIQTIDNKSDTKFSAVRFGNVLGSNGSVIPLFKKQIAMGGPVTITHPDIMRYFMTVTEAVSLVLQAGTIARGGEIFVLDMGKPVLIKDMAESLIRLSGYTPYEDIDIVYTGLRSGEKLYEEIMHNNEELKKTENELIHIGKPIVINEVRFLKQLSDLKNCVNDSPDEIYYKVKEMVDTFSYDVEEVDDNIALLSKQGLG